MKTKNNLQLILFVVLAFSINTKGISQNILQGQVSPDLKEAASETVEMWTVKLALSNKQESLMEDKIVEFSLKKNRILQSKMREELKTQKLKELQILENRDMRDILTGPQYDKYLSILTKRIKKQEKRFKK